MADGNRKIVFFGTPGICLPFLESLHRAFELTLIVTQPDSYGGRGKKKIVPAVKKFALEKGIDCIQPQTLSEAEVIERIRRIDPVLGVVISYGKIIPKAVFTIPRYRTVNVHFSLLPQYRGAAPVQRALQNGETETGITIFQINRKMDAGAIWSEMALDIAADDTTASLWERMSRIGAPFLVETLEGILAGKLKKRKQDETRVTFAPAVTKDEGMIDWHLPARQIYDKFRAFTPWPGLHCTDGGKLFKITKMAVGKSLDPKAEESPEMPGPGAVVKLDKKKLQILCGGNTCLEITELQPPGKKPMTPYCYCLGNRLPEHLS